MGTWLFEPGHTAAMFRARHMMVTYVRGHFKNVSGSPVFDPENPAQSSADVAIDAAAIWTPMWFQHQQNDPSKQTDELATKIKRRLGSLPDDLYTLASSCG